MQVAIKLVNKSKINVKPRRLERIRREIDFMANINHPHIIKILEGNFIYKTNKQNTKLDVKCFLKKNCLINQFTIITLV